MGCAVGKSRGLRDAQRQVKDLSEALEDAKREREDLKRQLEAAVPSPEKIAVVSATSPNTTAGDLSTPGKPSESADEAATTEASASPCANAAPPQVSGAAADNNGEESGLLNETADGEVRLPILPGSIESGDELLTDHRETTSPSGSLEGSLELEEARENVDTPPGFSHVGDIIEKPDLVGLCKLSNSLDSEASTCSPAVLNGGSSLPICAQCSTECSQVYLDPSDMHKYCGDCWNEYYGDSSRGNEMRQLINVEVAEYWKEGHLAQVWSEQTLPGWPPAQSQAPPIDHEDGGETWSNVSVRVRRDVVGQHAREHATVDRLSEGMLLRGRYSVEHSVGDGHFTKAYLAQDMQTGTDVCLKQHRNLSMEALADLMVIGRRLEEVDPDGESFPRLYNTFFDIVGYTVESLIEGKNCLAVGQADPGFFADVENLRHVACGSLHGLALLEQAGIVHNDMKPDNIMWLDTPLVGHGAASASGAGSPSVRIVDFGCARLTSHEERGRNWSLAEGGAGHLGKWAPEMTLRLPITHQNDVWGLGVALCELHCGRVVWRNESDTAEVVLAQALGLCDLRDGLPSSLLRRSPLDVRQLYTPALTSGVRGHLPLRRNALGQLEALRPSRYGLEQVIGEDWKEAGKGDFQEFLKGALTADPARRPSAAQLLACYRFVQETNEAEDTAAVLAEIEAGVLTGGYSELREETL
jgi:serine/threonine protein kinase